MVVHGCTGSSDSITGVPGFIGRFFGAIKMGIKIDEKINLVPGEYTVGVYIKDEDQYFAEFIGEDYFMVE